MFTMMNNARLSVGLQGLALSERAFQMAGYIEAAGVAGGPWHGRRWPRTRR